MRIALNRKPPRLSFVFARIIAPDSRTCADTTRFQIPVFDPYCCAKQILTVQTLVDRHRLAKFSGTAGYINVARRVVSKPPHRLDIFEGFDGANQNGCGITARFSHHIQTKVESVNHVDVSMSGLTE